MKNYKFRPDLFCAPLYFLLAVLILFPAFLNAQAVTADDGVKSDFSLNSERALSGAMSMMNAQKFAGAKKILKEAIQKDPLNDLLWLSYDSCVRSEMLAKKTAEDKSISTQDNNSMRTAVTKGGNEADGAGLPVKNPESINAGAKIPEQSDETPVEKTNEKDIECAILDADFSGGSAAGDLACLLNDTFKFINAGGEFYLSARAKDKNATVSFSFNISKFPKKVKLLITHRLVKKDRFLSAADLVIDLNEHKVNYDSIKLGNKIETSEYDITNMSKTGVNILTLSVENSAHPYLLKNVKVMLYFKD